MHVEYMRRTKPFEETILNTDIQNNRWNQRFLELLAEHFPTRQSAYTEIINLKAILNLPKGTEHFMSDLHGEYEAFEHILGLYVNVLTLPLGMNFQQANAMISVRLFIIHVKNLLAFMPKESQQVSGTMTRFFAL